MTRYTPKHFFPRELEAFAGDKAGLRRFYKSDPIAPKVLDIFATKENDTKVTTVTRLVAILRDAGFKIERPDIIRVFKVLEGFGCGVYLQGKQRAVPVSQQSRFEWKVSRGLSFRLSATREQINWPSLEPATT